MQGGVTCPKCGFAAEPGEPECLRCGIVFSRYDPDRRHPSQERIEKDSDRTEHLNQHDLWIYRIGKLTVISIMSFFFFYMVFMRSSWCLLDYVNLPFHEFGHLLFGFFGETLQFLGGTISQLMWPAILLVYFLRRNEHLSASFCLFWFGENFLNISKYVSDARSMSLPLVGGGIHDWNFLLGKWGMLGYDHAIGNAIFALGVMIMLGSMGWAFFAKRKQITQ